MYATQRLGRLLQEHDAAAWALELLVTQLYDPAFEVCEAAAHYLETACEDMHVLEAVVRLRPTLDHLGDVGQCLLMRYVVDGSSLTVDTLSKDSCCNRFLSTSAGFPYLCRADYIDREIDEWYHVSKKKASATSRLLRRHSSIETYNTCRKSSYILRISLVANPGLKPTPARRQYKQTHLCKEDRVNLNLEIATSMSLRQTFTARLRKRLKAVEYWQRRAM
jgi:hypothetical protein